MCNLYDIGPARHRNREDWESAVMEAIRQLEKPYGIRKTDPALAITSADPTGAIVTMRWGFERSYNPAVNNSRTDKLDGVWSELWQQKQRCLIPVSTFYEWSGGAGNKQTYAFQSAEPDHILWAAGLWEPARAGKEAACAMLTREASGPIASIHHRMPVILRREHHEAFFREADPRSLLASSQDDFTMFRCYNPLKSPGTHQGPEKEATDLLPGFDS